MSAKILSEKIIKKRKFRLWRNVAFWGLGFLIIFAGFAFLWYSSLIQVEGYTVKNKNNDELQPLPARQSIFAVSEADIIKSVEEKYKDIKNVRVSKWYIPKAYIEVRFDDRTPKGLYCVQAMPCSLIDEDGVILSIPNTNSNFVPEITIYASSDGLSIEKKIVDSARAIVGVLKENYPQEPWQFKSITIANDDSFSVSTGLFNVVFDEESASTSARTIILALKAIPNFKELSYVDVRFGNKVYFK